ncbi:dimethyladenosine transferase [Candidatus Tremblaya phenacola PAVE]|nr:dimethyladenosine transferase [Candidatus Tremblaya phenacola PAVE]
MFGGLIRCFPKKHLGQNFLISNSIWGWVILKGKETKYNVELCSGYGPLTIMLLKSKAPITASIELDGALAFMTAKRYSLFLSAFVTNILTFSFKRFGRGMQFVLRGNLPFGITKPLLSSIPKCCLSGLCLMLHPNSPVLVGAFATIQDVSLLSYQFGSRTILILDSSYFFPRPKINCFLLRLGLRFCSRVKLLILRV